MLFLQLYNKEQLVVRITTQTKHFLLSLSLGHLARADIPKHVTLPRENFQWGLVWGLRVQLGFLHQKAFKIRLSGGWDGEDTEGAKAEGQRKTTVEATPLWASFQARPEAPSRPLSCQC